MSNIISLPPLDLAAFDADKADSADAFRAQSILRGGGFYTGALDGEFGPKSRLALIAWRAACLFVGDMPRIGFYVAGVPYYEHSDDSVSWTGPFMSDSDGDGPHLGDRTAQDDTSLHLNGRPLNASVDRYIVAAPELEQCVPGRVLGAKAYVKNLLNGKDTDAVVGDTGGKRDAGEGAMITLSTVGVNPSPVSGGEPRHCIFFRVWPGVPAPGYELQRA